MAIKIRQTPYMRFAGDHQGPFPVYPDEVRAQLMVIAMAGSTELPGSLGEDPDADPDFTVISYDPGPQDAGTAAGRVRLLLKELVDRAGAVEIVGAGPEFVWDDGTNFEDGSAGGALGNLVFYDTQNNDGDGRWVRGTDGEEVCSTSAGILFHELGHQKLNHPVGTVDEDERAAVGIENDLREAEGLVKRDPDHWFESGAGCPGGCCIVASIASGSPFSAEVHALRRVRDGMLRGTGLGARFFAALYREYYSFSVGVCRVMVRDEAAREQVEAWLVRPLVRALELALAHARQPAGDQVLTAGLSEDTAGGRFLGLDGPVAAVAWREVAGCLRALAVGAPLPAMAAAGPPGTAVILGLLASRLPDCPHVRWGIVEPLALYAEARALLAADGDAAAAARWLGGSFDRWLGDLPLAECVDGIGGVTAEEIAGLEADLDRLASTVYRRPAARHRLGPRLLAALDASPRSRFARRLRALEYLP